MLRFFSTLCLAILCLTISCAVAFAQDDAPTVESVRSRLSEVESKTTLTEEAKTAIRSFFEQATSELEATAKESAEADQYSQMARTAPEDLGRTKRDLAILLELAEWKPPDGVSLEVLQARLSERQAELQQLKKEADRLNSEPQRRATRRREIPEQLAVNRKELEKLDRQIKRESKPDELPELTEARNTYLRVRRALLQQKLAVGSAELEAYKATIDLLALQRDYTTARLARTQREVNSLQRLIKRRRASEVNEHRRLAADALRDVSDPFKPLAQRNLELVERRRHVRDRSEQVAQETAAAEQVAVDLERQRTRIENKVDTVGLTSAIGLLLRKQKSLLPDVRSYQRMLRLRQPELRTAQLAALEMEDRRADLVDLDAELQRQAAQLGAGSPEALSEEDREQLRSLLVDERRYADYLIADANEQVEQLLKLERVQRQIVADTERLAKYIDERVLWVRSGGTFSRSDLTVAAEAARYFVDGGRWRRTGAALVTDIKSQYAAYVLLLLAALLIRVLGWYLAVQRARSARHGRPHRLRRLMRDAAEVILCAAPLPLLLWFLGLRLASLPEDAQFHAVGLGLISVAGDLLPLALLLRASVPRGFARRHLAWSDDGIRQIHRMVFVLILTVIPLTFVRATLHVLDNVRWYDSLGRICFIVNVLVVSVLVERLIRPRGGALYRALVHLQPDWLMWLRWIWYLLGVGAHVALAVMAFVGYTYAADLLGVQVRATAMLVLCLLVVGSLLMHWTRLNSRRLAMRRARGDQEDPASSVAAELGLPAAAKEEIWFRFEPSGSKMRPLVSSLLMIIGVVGLWIIWVDVVPAFGVVNQITLWHTEVAVSVPEPDADSEPSMTRRLPERIPVTLGDVLLAAFILLATIVATRYIAGLFELPILERLPLDSAMQSTITTVTRYVLWMVAVLVAAAFLGISWSKVQWLAAAFSVGLGFGMQEIFANFISGLIILFERPMRVGDIITVGDATGVVRSISMRATTIMDWDRKELVVPNKEFATGRLLNWTLTNKTNRRVIRVAVEYGTDPDLVRELLLKVARASERVLNDPAPIALFEEYGESALIFSLRVYHPKISHRLRGLHELNTAIQQEFKGAGIRFAFPHRDLLLRNAPPSINWFGPQEEQDPDRYEAPS